MFAGTDSWFWRNIVFSCSLAELFLNLCFLLLLFHSKQMPACIFLGENAWG